MSLRLSPIENLTERPVKGSTPPSRRLRRCLAPAAVRCCAALLICALIPFAARAQTVTTLANLKGTNGANPLFGTLLQGPDGNLYGTTSAGGAHAQGTVFKMTPTGTLVTLYNFCSKGNCADGSVPYTGLILATDGNFYGTTQSGGASRNGTVFKITPKGALTTLHSFNSRDGAMPYAALLQASDGNFYGTTESGGANLLGTIFKMTPAGKLTTLHSFNSTDGSSPEAPLTQASDGNFYGTTYNGGTEGYGTVFKMTPAGKLTTLHIFGDPDGRAITAGLVEDAQGNFYGATTLGGVNGYGSVYTITPQGSLTILHAFGATDGASPNGLALGTDGNLYGTTISGGANTDGILFEVTPLGAFSTLYTFNGSNGADSFASLVQATDGNFYGTTRVGGSKNDGTIFRLDAGLSPFVVALPNLGKAGAKIKILGNTLTGATSVTFNGTPAAFTVVSASQILTTVPAAAASGTIQVTTPTAILSSRSDFQVKQ
jgi:uncharacterized repeat protein (TIGR03803 family)